MASLSLAFAGHMIDLPDRKEPRFPPSLEAAVRAAIALRVHSQRHNRSANDVRGYASLARGGDILLHEVCRAEGLRTVIVLPFAPEQFLRASVEGVPSGDWPARFKSLWEETPSEDKEVMALPVTQEAYALCNIRILDLARAAGHVHLIALWNGEEGDGPGGTADLVRRAEAMGDRPSIIDPRKL